MTKNSVSPDKYHINNNLVVQLADPIRKPNADMQQTSVTTKNQKQMYQTSYKAGQKASFFPSTATATTNGTSQDNGSNDPRRQTAAEGTRGNNNFNGQNGNYGQKPQSRQNNTGNGSFELNLPLRFGKNGQKRSIQGG